MAIAQLEKSPNQMLAMQYAPQLRQDAAGAQPPPLTSVDTARGSVRTFVDPVTGRPAMGPDGKPMTISGGVIPETTAGKVNEELRLGQITPAQAQAELAKDQPESWHVASPAEKQARGLPAASQFKISSHGNVEGLPREPGQIGAAYNSDTGQPLGVIDYTDPKYAPKLASGEILTQQPKVLDSSAVDTLSKQGQQVAQLQGQMDSYKPEYARILGSDSKLRGYIGGKAFNEASEWFNKTQGILLNTVKDTVGRSPQLIEEFNKNRPEAYDAADVVQRKMKNLMAITKDAAAQTGRTYLQGGYLGRQVKTALSFDPTTVQPYTNPDAPPAGAGGMPQVKSTEDYNKIPSGAQYVDPDGHTRVKP